MGKRLKRLTHALGLEIGGDKSPREAGIAQRVQAEYNGALLARRVHVELAPALWQLQDPLVLEEVLPGEGLGGQVGQWSLLYVIRVIWDGPCATALKCCLPCQVFSNVACIVRCCLHYHTRKIKENPPRGREGLITMPCYRFDSPSTLSNQLRWWGPKGMGAERKGSAVLGTGLRACYGNASIMMVSIASPVHPISRN